ncbi:uncharacterized protein LODBEIA_P06040 [Lodderomyces beijingensis]|uniref:Uncharacterized protein n=1 Tax=Lodderomyces beijingensis TaxID=1775926 RepID=A0ABP0ZGU0_9ASCO
MTVPVRGDEEKTATTSSSEGEPPKEHLREEPKSEIPICPHCARLEIDNGAFDDQGIKLTRLQDSDAFQLQQLELKRHLTRRETLAANPNRTWSQKLFEHDLPPLAPVSSYEEDVLEKKYGHTDSTGVKYIKGYDQRKWIMRPRALNFHKDGVLHRTKGRRGSSRPELFLDLLYVGMIANLANNAAGEPAGVALLEYFIFFMPVWTVWNDIKDFSNFYYNEDLTQVTTLFWIICLLVFYINSHVGFNKSYSQSAAVVVPYMLCRLTLATSLIIYSFYIPEHRTQQRLYAGTIVVTSLSWIAVIFVSIRVKIALALAFFFLEQLSSVICFHPLTKRLLRLSTSIAMNLEHEMDRYSTFVTIAIGEFLYVAVAKAPLGEGFSSKYLRGVFLLLDAYLLFWLYFFGGLTFKAIHPLRNNVWTSTVWSYSHLPLISALVLAANAGGEMCKIAVGRTQNYDDMLGLAFFYNGGICVALWSLLVQGLVEKNLDGKGAHCIGPKWKISLRLFVGLAVVLVSFAEINATLLMGVTTALLFGLFVFECFVDDLARAIVGMVKHRNSEEKKNGSR